MRVKWELQEPMNHREWGFWVNREGIPQQMNSYDCGLYAVYYGFCFELVQGLDLCSLEWSGDLHALFSGYLSVFC
jgi:hypothetical protein